MNRVNEIAKKEVTMSFQIEADLSDSFTSAIEKEHRPAAQVISELIRDYITNVEKHEMITSEERNRRAEAVREAHASVAMEGLPVSEAEKEHANRFIAGEMTLAEFLSRQ